MAFTKFDELVRSTFPVDLYCAYKVFNRFPQVAPAVIAVVEDDAELLFANPVMLLHDVNNILINRVIMLILFIIVFFLS